MLPLTKSTDEQLNRLQLLLRDIIAMKDQLNHDYITIEAEFGIMERMKVKERSYDISRWKSASDAIRRIRNTERENRETIRNILNSLKAKT